MQARTVKVVLAAGDSATVALANGQGVQLTLNKATADGLVENSDTIKADNGSVLLKSAVNLDGVIRAGTIVADAGNTGDATLTMLANGSIQLNGNVTTTSGKLNMNLTADRAVTITAR